jgi:hypothetical protein
MGLEIAPNQPKPRALTPAQTNGYAAWIRANGFGGVAVWSIDRDYRRVSGRARGAFTAALARGL